MSQSFSSSRSTRSVLLGAWLLAAAAPALAQLAAPAAVQDVNELRQVAERFLVQQSAGLPGKVEVSIAQTAPRGLAQCAALEPFLPPGGRLWGRATVGVRCSAPRPWTVYFQARIAVHGTYYVAARGVNPGDTLSAADLVAREGDLTVLPAAVVTDPAQAIGAVANNRITAGLPIRSDLIRAAMAVRAGQPVKLVAQGQGFAVSSEGSALANASPGQTVRVRTASGSVVSGTVLDDSSVQVAL